MVNVGQLMVLIAKPVEKNIIQIYLRLMMRIEKYGKENLEGFIAEFSLEYRIQNIIMGIVDLIMDYLVLAVRN